VITGRDDRVLVANAAFRQALGLGAIVAEGRPLVELAQNETLLSFVATSPDNGQSYKSEIPLADGRTLYATLTPIPDVGRVVIMQDVTYFKRLDQMKSDFVATVSHDLRAPLTSIKSYAQMLEMFGELNEKQTTFVDRIVRAADHIAALITDLLDLSKIEAGIDLELTVLDLNQVMADATGQLQEEAGRKQQKMVCFLPAQPIWVRGHRLRLHQVITNLLSNAVKYTPESGQITVMLQASDGRALFKVEDNGLGIPPADLPFVFDKFYRVKNEDRAGIPGTGLGLSICKSIIEKHGGDIWVESQYHQGSIFCFTLPLCAADQTKALRTDPLNMAAN
jgi:two-component system NtrC family sensor kinase